MPHPHSYALLPSDEQFRWLSSANCLVYNRHSSEIPVAAPCYKPKGHYTHEGYNTEKWLFHFQRQECQATGDTTSTDK